MARQLPTGARIGKVWGWTKALLQTATVEVQHLKVKAGYRCSDHYHGHKVNRFYVLRGRLKVVTRKGGLEDETVLGPGEMTDVLPGDEHRFEALTACELIELYWVTLDPDDIVRRTQGGPTDPTGATHATPEATPGGGPDGVRGRARPGGRRPGPARPGV